MRAQSVRVVESGSTVTASVWFEGLDDIELGGLIAALDPSCLLLDAIPPTRFSEAPTTKLHTHLGGGKGLGLGSVEVSRLELHLEDRGRYEGVDAAQLDGESVGGLVDQFREHNHRRLSATWVQLAAMLDPGRVNPERVSYPPGANWSQANDHEAFDTPFEFFKMSQGGSFKSAPPILPMPEPDDNEDITLPIIAKRDRSR